VIIKNGETIYPIEIEEFLYTHPDILNVQVVGVPDKKCGEEIMAWIIPEEGTTLDENAIRDFCKGNIADDRIPKYIEFTDEYPTTASGKIMKSRLQEMSINKMNL